MRALHNHHDRPAADRVVNARDAALRVLSDHARRMPDLMPAEPETDGMAPRDAALAHMLIDASLRRWITLSFILEMAGGRDIRDTEPGMQAALVAGAAQILLLDRIPDHAAIDETVEWAKHRIRPKAAGMVNAILRRVIDARGERIEAWDDRTDAIPLSDGGAVTLRGVRLPDDDEYRLVIASSLPGALLKSWSGTDSDLTGLALHTLVHPPTICFVGGVESVASDVRFVPHEQADHAVFTGERSELGEALSRHPGVWVQDSAASEVVSGLNNEGEALVVDLCAGRGTKTRQLLRAFPDATIIASEIDDARLNAMEGVFAEEPRVEVVHGEDLKTRGTGWADLVLTDVPCSNSGVLARRTEARYRVRSDAMKRLIGTQREILETAGTLVRSGGRLVYSTCSLEREENQDQAAWAGRTLGLTTERERTVLPQGEPGDPATMYRDASYAAELRRPG